MTSAPSCWKRLVTCRTAVGCTPKSRGVRRDPEAPAGDPARGRVLLKEAFVADRRGRYAEAVRAIHRAERILDGVLSPAADRLHTQLLVWLADRADQGLMARAIVATPRQRRTGPRSPGTTKRAHFGLLVLDFAEEASGRAPDWQRTTDALEVYTGSVISAVRRPRRTCSARPPTTTAAGPTPSTGTRGLGSRVRSTATR